MIALGVRDLPRSVKFYRDGLGFSPSSASKESIAFFKMGGTMLALYPWDKLAEDAQVPDDGHGFRGVTLAHNVRERKEGSEVLAMAAASGGKIIKPAQDVFWGATRLSPMARITQDSVPDTTMSESISFRPAIFRLLRLGTTAHSGQRGL